MLSLSLLLLLSSSTKYIFYWLRHALSIMRCVPKGLASKNRTEEGGKGKTRAKGRRNEIQELSLLVCDCQLSSEIILLPRKLSSFFFLLFFFSSPRPLKSRNTQEMSARKAIPLKLPDEGAWESSLFKVTLNADIKSRNCVIRCYSFELT